MPEYEVNLYYTGFLILTINAENEENPIEKARSEQDGPCNRDMLIKRFETILETLEHLKDCDTAELKDCNSQ